MNQPVQTVAQHGYMQRAGVCRDFGHLAMTLCGALYIPARQFAGAAPFKEPPPNFHALFEVCVSDCWIFLGATRMAPPEHGCRMPAAGPPRTWTPARLFGPASMRCIAPEIRLAD